MPTKSQTSPCRRPSGLALLLLGCHGGGPGTPPRDAPVAFARGEIVVIERASAEFFQARVLSVADATIRVQTSEDGEPVVVARSDAYRVPPAAHVFAPADPGICAEPRSHWSPCRIVRADDQDGFVVSLDTGAELHVEKAGVLAPSSVTALNIVRHFDTTEARRRFEVEARAAGSPVRPPGWVPERREPVIAGRRGEWFSAHVAELLEDAGVRVVWDGDDRAEAVGSDQVVPAPPVSRGQPRTSFALRRPSTVSQPWERVRIEAWGPDQAVVVGVDGAKRRLEVRGLVPLVAAPTPPASAR